MIIVKATRSLCSALCVHVNTFPPDVKQPHNQKHVCQVEQTDLYVVFLNYILPPVFLRSDIDDRFISPCGGCRQVMREVFKSLLVYRHQELLVSSL